MKKWEPELRGGANYDIDRGGKYKEGRGNEKEIVTFPFFFKDQQSSSNMGYRFYRNPSKQTDPVYVF